MIIFANGKSFEDISVFGSTTVLQNANRRTLEITIAEDKATFEELLSIYTDVSALDTITTKAIVEEDGVISETQNVHLHFTIPVSLGTAFMDGNPVWIMKVAEKTALELTQEKQATDIENIEAALIELAEMEANNG